MTREDCGSAEVSLMGSSGLVVREKSPIDTAAQRHQNRRGCLCFLQSSRPQIR